MNHNLIRPQPARRTGRTRELDPRAGLLMDHYKDTCAIVVPQWKARNRLFMYTLIVLTIIAIDTFTPLSLDSFVDTYVKNELGERVPSMDLQDYGPLLGFEIVDLLARFLLLCLVIQYYQRSMHIDRQYHYLDDLEKKICGLMGGFYVAREGRAYFSRSGVPQLDQPDERPRFLRWVGPLYVYIFPLVLCALMVWKFQAQDLATDLSVINVLSALCSLAIVLYSFLYVRWRVWQR